MNSFVWGALVGALSMYLYLEGTAPFVDAARSVWTNASRAPVEQTDR